MRWLRDHVSTDGVVTTTDTWLVHQLCGDFVTDASTASRSLIYHLDTGNWDESLLDIFGLADEELPRIVASDDIVGTTVAFGADIPVTGLIVDQQAALLAESCFDAGTAKCTYGTGAFLLAQVGTEAGPLQCRADDLGRVAARGTRPVLRRRAGVHRCLGSAMDQ